MKFRSTSATALMIALVGCTSHPDGNRKAADDSGQRVTQAGATASVATPLPSPQTGTTQSTTPQSDTSRTALAQPTSVPTTLGQWEQFDFNTQAVPASALASLSLEEVQRIRAIVFGRHGRIFQDSTLQSWLTTRPWYHPQSEFGNEYLTDGEKQNLEVIREAEAAKHTQIEPGDMRFYTNRVITTAMLGHHSAPDWEIIEAEVLANHGYVFTDNGDDEPPNENRELAPGQLQRYFDERYWYDREGGFEASQLSTIEQQNLDTIAFAIMKENKRKISPGVMHFFTATLLTDTMLANVNLADLRLIRNEIYARHGRPFATEWLAQHFKSQPWYTPRRDYNEAELSPIEKANIALISKREDELHRDLSSKLLTRADVMGLVPDDARRLRNEIYARHGRRFQDPQLRRYFASFSWYKPSSSFREGMLSETEKRNAQLISLYEHGRFTEG